MDSPANFEISPAGIAYAPPLLQPELAVLYTRRIERLHELSEPAKGQRSAMADYLDFVAEVVTAQQQVLRAQPLPAAKIKTPIITDWQHLPFDKTSFPRDIYWQMALDALIDQLRESRICAAAPIQASLSRLREMPGAEREAAATLLLAHDISGVGADGAPFMWAALSLYFAQLARNNPLEAHEDVGVARHRCPLCGGDPVASIVTIGPPEGVRYLHCSLCESEWHVVRAQCTNCEASGKLHYWSLDDNDAAVKSESCGDCHSHLKILYQPKNGHVDPVADDLATLALDARLEEEGFARSTVNPFLFVSGVAD